MSNGWIKLHRSILEWGWWDSTPHRILFLELLMRCNYKVSEWRLETLMPGEIVTGRKQLSKWTGLSERKIRTVLKDLKTTNELTIKNRSKYSIISITNWEKFQGDDQQNDQQVTSKRPANDQQTTTSKKERKKEVKKERTKNNNNSPNFSENRAEVDQIIECWNAQKIIVHKVSDKLVEDVLKNMKKKKEYKLEEIVQAIKNYSFVLNSPDFIWTHKWDLKEFLGRSNSEKFFGSNFDLDRFPKKILTKSEQRFKNVTTMENPYA